MRFRHCRFAMPLLLRRRRLRRLMLYFAAELLFSMLSLPLFHAVVISICFLLFFATLTPCRHVVRHTPLDAMLCRYAAR